MADWAFLAGEAHWEGEATRAFPTSTQERSRPDFPIPQWPLLPSAPNLRMQQMEEYFLRS